MFSQNKAFLCGIILVTNEELTSLDEDNKGDDDDYNDTTTTSSTDKQKTHCTKRAHGNLAQEWLETTAAEIRTHKRLVRTLILMEQYKTCFGESLFLNQQNNSKNMLNKNCILIRLCVSVWWNASSSGTIFNQWDCIMGRCFG